MFNFAPNSMVGNFWGEGRSLWGFAKSQKHEEWEWESLQLGKHPERVWFGGRMSERLKLKSGRCDEKRVGGRS